MLTKQEKKEILCLINQAIKKNRIKKPDFPVHSDEALAFAEVKWNEALERAYNGFYDKPRKHHKLTLVDDAGKEAPEGTPSCTPGYVTKSNWLLRQHLVNKLTGEEAPDGTKFKDKGFITQRAWENKQLKKKKLSLQKKGKELNGLLEDDSSQFSDNLSVSEQELLFFQENFKKKALSSERIETVNSRMPSINPLVLEEEIKPFFLENMDVETESMKVIEAITNDKSPPYLSSYPCDEVPAPFLKLEIGDSCFASPILALQNEQELFSDNYCFFENYSKFFSKECSENKRVNREFTLHKDDLASTDETGDSVNKRLKLG